jgi:hypothetical protein
MVNSGLQRLVRAYAKPDLRFDSNEKSDSFSVNGFLSKGFEFFENFRRIRFEYAQKSEPPLQSYALASAMR